MYMRITIRMTERVWQGMTMAFESPERAEDLAKSLDEQLREYDMSASHINRLLQFPSEQIQEASGGEKSQPEA
jgi:Fe-S cluster assembly ATPase SufC